MRFSRWMALAGAGLIWASAAVAEDEPQAAAAKGATFYQASASGECSGGNCTVRLAKASGGKVIETTNLSCFATATGFNAPPYATFQAGSKLVSYLPLLPYAVGSNTVATGAGAGTVFIAKGQVPTVVIGSVTSASCTLSGRLIAK